MAITLRFNPELEAQLANEAAANGLPVNEYLEKLVEQFAAVTPSRRTPREIKEHLAKLAKKWHEMPTLDDRTPEQILDYDHFGMPRDDH